MKLDVIKGIKGIKGKVVMVPTRNTGEVNVQSGFSMPIKKQITNIEWQHKEGRSGGKAAVGAIGGGLLAGPLGLIAGAAIGGKKNEISTAVINFEEGGEIIVKMTAKQYEELYSWVNP